MPGERLSSGERRVRVYRIDEHAANARALLEELLTRMEVPCRVSVRRGTGTSRLLVGRPGDPRHRGRRPRAPDRLARARRCAPCRPRSTSCSARKASRAAASSSTSSATARGARIRCASWPSASRSRVKRTGEPYTLDPMHAYERRVIHMTLADDPDVTTESSGTEPARRVVINPTGPAQGGPPERFEGSRQGRSGGRPYSTGFAVESLCRRDEADSGPAARPHLGRRRVHGRGRVAPRGRRDERHQPLRRAHGVQGRRALPDARETSARRSRASAACSTRRPIARRRCSGRGCRPRSSTSRCRCSPTCSSARRSTPTEVVKERQVVIEELRMYQDNPQDYVADPLRRGDVAGPPARLGRRRPRGDGANLHRRRLPGPPRRPCAARRHS